MSNKCVFCVRLQSKQTQREHKNQPTTTMTMSMMMKIKNCARQRRQAKRWNKKNLTNSFSMSECLQKSKRKNTILNHNHIAQLYVQIYVWKSVIIANRNAVGRNPAGIQANNFSLCLCIVFNCKCAISLSYACFSNDTNFNAISLLHCSALTNWWYGRFGQTKAKKKNDNNNNSDQPTQQQQQHQRWREKKQHTNCYENLANKWSNRWFRPKAREFNSRITFSRAPSPNQRIANVYRLIWFLLFFVLFRFFHLFSAEDAGALHGIDGQRCLVIDVFVLCSASSIIA